MKQRIAYRVLAVASLAAAGALGYLAHVVVSIVQSTTKILEIGEYAQWP